MAACLQICDLGRVANISSSRSSNTLLSSFENHTDAFNDLDTSRIQRFPSEIRVVLSQ